MATLTDTDTNAHGFTEAQILVAIFSGVSPKEQERIVEFFPDVEERNAFLENLGVAYLQDTAAQQMAFEFEEV